MGDDESLSEQDVDEIYIRYQELAVTCADCVVRGDDPRDQDWFGELEDCFLELAHREEQGEIPTAERADRD